MPWDDVAAPEELAAAVDEALAGVEADTPDGWLSIISDAIESVKQRREVC